MLPNKKTIRQSGLLLGLGVAFLALGLHFISKGELSVVWFFEQLQSNAMLFGVLFFFLPVALWLFGGYVGNAIERVKDKQISLEHLNQTLTTHNELLHKANEELKNKVVTDALTGLYTHQQFLIQMDREFARIYRHPHPKPEFHVLMVDVDNFKKINDEHGHLAGNHVLHALAGILRLSVRRYDVVARYGGDEFEILMPETSLDTVREVAQRINENVATHDFNSFDKEIKVTISIGLASSREVGDHYPVDLTEIIEKADTHLLDAKRDGKNRIAS